MLDWSTRLALEKTESNLSPYKYRNYSGLRFLFFFVLVNTFLCLWSPILKIQLTLDSWKIHGRGTKPFEVCLPQLFHQASKNRLYMVHRRASTQTLYISCLMPHGGNQQETRFILEYFTILSSLWHAQYTFHTMRLAGFFPSYILATFAINTLLTRLPSQKKKKKNAESTLVLPLKIFTNLLGKVTDIPVGLYIT